MSGERGPGVVTKKQREATAAALLAGASAVARALADAADDGEFVARGDLERRTIESVMRTCREAMNVLVAITFNRCSVCKGRGLRCDMVIQGREPELVTCGHCQGEGVEPRLGATV